MRCRDVHALTSAYLDGALDDARASALRGHARMCPSCLALVQDMAAIRDTMAGLEPEDPPPTLWAAVERGLAEAEMADARRSPLWLRWQQVRPRLLPAAVAMAASLAMGLWLLRGPGAGVAGPGPERGAAAGLLQAEAAPAPWNGQDFFARQGDELAHADQRYETIRAELRQIVAVERTRWPADAATRFDSRLAAFDAEARRYRQELDPDTGPPGRDALYAVYQAEIAFLQSAAVYGASALDTRPGLRPEHAPAIRILDREDRADWPEDRADQEDRP